MAKARAAQTAASFSSAQVIDLITNASQSLKTICATIEEVEKQRTERVRIEGQARAYVARVQATRDVMLAYLEKSFDERRELFTQFFSVLDQAMAQGNVQAMSVTLDSMVDLAKSSPFKALQDAAAFEKAIGDPETEWRF